MDRGGDSTFGELVADDPSGRNSAAQLEGFTFGTGVRVSVRLVTAKVVSTGAVVLAGDSIGTAGSKVEVDVGRERSESSSEPNANALLDDDGPCGRVCKP